LDRWYRTPAEAWAVWRTQTEALLNDYETTNKDRPNAAEKVKSLRAQLAKADKLMAEPSPAVEPEVEADPFMPSAT
jgi:hypothetical protein